MHVIMMLIALVTAWCMRLIPGKITGTWRQRWQRSLLIFVFPPCLLLSTSVAVILMGFEGEMLGVKASWISYILAVVFVSYASFLLLKLVYQGYQSHHKIVSYQQQIVAGKIARVINIDLPYSAQIGFWHPELVISQGLLDSLDHEHLSAVLAHEQAHVDYHDNFWFFWLGWLRRLTNWLPNTEVLWQELLLLRELRADKQAAQQTEPILLAESLLKVVKMPLESSAIFCANFGCNSVGERLMERIDFILAETESVAYLQWWSLSWIILLFIPLFTIPLHY